MGHRQTLLACRVCEAGLDRGGAVSTGSFRGRSSRSSML